MGEGPGILLTSHSNVSRGIAIGKAVSPKWPKTEKLYFQATPKNPAGKQLRLLRTDSRSVVGFAVWTIERPKRIGDMEAA